MNIFRRKQKEESGFLAKVLSFSSSPPRKGTADIIRSYKDMPWFRAVVNKVAKSIASVSWELYVVREQGKAVKVSKIQRASHNEKIKLYKKKAVELEEIEEHPLLDLLNNCNSYMTGAFMRQLTQIYLDSVGEAFWIKERNNLGMPIELWPVPPTDVVDIPTHNKPFFSVRLGSITTEIPATEVIWFKEPDPENPYARGSGIGMALGDELATDELAAKHTKTWFYNRARPDLLISGDNLTPTDTERLEQRWLSESKGFWNAYKPLFLSRRVDVKELSQSFSDMELISLRKYERDLIIQVFGVPPEIMGIVENSNRATIDAASYIYTVNCLIPRLETIRECLQMYLVPDFDERIIVDYVSPVAEDKEYHLRAAQSASWALTINEWREMMGKEPLPDDKGDARLTPMALLETRGEQTTETLSYKSIKSSLWGEEEQIKRWDSSVNLWLKRENQWKRELKKYFQKQQDEVMDKLRKQKIGTEEVLFDKDEYNKMLNELAKPLIIEVVKDGARDTAELIGFDYSLFNVYNPHLQKWVGNRLDLIKDINDVTIEKLRATLDEGIKAGEGISKLANRVSEVFSEAKGWRAENIARTETLTAYRHGNGEVYEQAGIEMVQWWAALDERTCEECLRLHGQEMTVEEYLDNVDSIHPSCRCSEIPITR
jgi:HK97 family phage portal protein